MSRSRKKPYVTLSKPWYNWNEKSLRGRVNRACREATFDPDKDWEELYLTNKEGAAWGTKFGYDIPPDEDDDFYKYYLKSQRK